jgi:DNA-binding NtrC family response regulator
MTAYDIIIASPRGDELKPFIQGLENEGALVRLAETKSKTLELVKAKAPHLVVIDDSLSDVQPLTLVKDLMLINAMINTAVITGMSAEQFHAKGEGLGILTSVSQHPDAQDAKALIQNLRKLAI